MAKSEFVTHDKEGTFSRFLVWMRTNHGRMGRTRYKEKKKCGGEVEDRDHILLRCEKWWEERWRVWKGIISVIGLGNIRYISGECCLEKGE